MQQEKVKQEREQVKLQRPTMEELEEYISEGICPAVCIHGCMVEPDGQCKHGKPSWLLKLGWI